MPGDVEVADPIHHAIAEQAGQLPVWDRAVRADDDDAVHQMRVTTRRIRSLLAASPEAFTGSGAVDDDLRWLAGMLGTARDAEVLGLRYRRALDRLAPHLVRGPVAARLVDAAAHRYRSGWAAAVAALDSPRYRRLLDGLGALAAAPPAVPPPGGVDEAYRRLLKTVKASAQAGDSGRDEALHRIRKAAKRLRYTAAAAGADRVAERAEAIQTLLGEHQDSVVSRAHLLAEAAAAHAAGEDTFTYGVLYEQEDDLARDCRAQLDGAVAELAQTMAAAEPPGGRVGL